MLEVKEKENEEIEQEKTEIIEMLKIINNQSHLDMIYGFVSGMYKRAKKEVG